MKKFVIGIVLVILIGIATYIFVIKNNPFNWVNSDFELLNIAREGKYTFNGNLTNYLIEDSLACILISNKFKQKYNISNYFRITGPDIVEENSLNSIRLELESISGLINLNKYILKYDTEESILLKYIEEINIGCCDKNIQDFITFFNHSFSYEGDGHISEFEKYGFLILIPRGVLTKGQYKLRLVVSFKNGKEINSQKDIEFR